MRENNHWLFVSPGSRQKQEKIIMSCVIRIRDSVLNSGDRNEFCPRLFEPKDLMELKRVYAGTQVPVYGYEPRNIGPRMQELVRKKLQELDRPGTIMVSINLEMHQIECIDNKEHTIGLEPLPEGQIIQNGNIFELVSMEELPKYPRRTWSHSK
jgi:hypothetical protein